LAHEVGRCGVQLTWYEHVNDPKSCVTHPGDRFDLGDQLAILLMPHFYAWLRKNDDEGDAMVIFRWSREVSFLNDV
jgi:hypothetical protein